MSEPDSTAPARDNARAVDGPEGDFVQQDKNRTEGPVASAKHDDRLADFNAAPIIAANARNKGTRKHLKSVYYDTPERALRRNGLSLRVRQSGARFVQSVKAEFGDDALRRGEWEASVLSIDPDLGLASNKKFEFDFPAGPGTLGFKRSRA